MTWRAELFGHLRAHCLSQSITRFRTYKTGALFAYLAYHCDKSHQRDLLTEIFWPDDSGRAGRNSLKTALNSLRRQLQTQGSLTDTVIRSDRFTVGINLGAIVTDVAEFEAEMHEAARANDDSQRYHHLLRAVELYRGPLLPGYYEDWALAEQRRLADLHCQALRELAAQCEGAGDFGAAIQFAHKVVGVDPLDEEAHCELIRLYLAAGHRSAAESQYEELERMCREQLGHAPPAAARAMMEKAESASDALPHNPIPTEPQLRKKNAPQRMLVNGTRIGGSTVPENAAIQLPVPFTRFFGGEKEIVQLTEMLAPTARTSPASVMVTLTGPGGIGKTRLATEAARKLADRFSGGLWFVPLAHVTDPSLVPVAIADALGLPRSPTTTPLEQLCEFLNRSAGRAMLILDNLEQIAVEAASIVLSIATRVQGITCLLTSRRRLGLPGERAFPVPPLAIPDGRFSKSGIGALMQLPSIQLFVDRAQTVRPDFQITPRNAQDIAALCSRLEGLPLAIELVATRAYVLTPSQMLAGVSERFSLLSSRRAHSEARHQSIGAAIDWSYRLLSPPLQRIFCRLSVFRGDWASEAASAVCLPQPSPEASDSTCDREFLEQLASLRLHSLIETVDHSTQMRFRLFESMREFGHALLRDDEMEGLSRRHADYFLRLAGDAEPHLTGSDQEQWMNRLEADLDNLRAALAYFERSDTQSGLRLAKGLGPFWALRGYWREGREWLQRLMAKAVTAPSALRAEALDAAGSLAWRQSDYEEAEAQFVESSKLGIEAGMPSHVARTLNNLGLIAYEQGAFQQATKYHQDSLAIRREIGDRRGIAGSLHNLGNVVTAQGDHARAVMLQQEALRINRELGNLSWAAINLEGLGQVAEATLDPTTARACFTESLLLRRELGDRRGIAFALCSLGRLETNHGELDNALAHLEESLSICEELGDRLVSGNVLAALGSLAVARNDFTSAYLYFSRSVSLNHTLGLRGGVAATLAELAELALARGHPGEGARLLGAVFGLRAAIGLVSSPSDAARLEQLIYALRDGLGDAGFDAAREEGRAMTEKEAVAYAIEHAAAD